MQCTSSDCPYWVCVLYGPEAERACVIPPSDTSYDTFVKKFRCQLCHKKAGISPPYEVTPQGQGHFQYASISSGFVVLYLHGPDAGTADIRNDIIRTLKFQMGLNSDYVSVITFPEALSYDTSPCRLFSMWLSSQLRASGTSE